VGSFSGRGGGVWARPFTVVWAVGSRLLPLTPFRAWCAPGALVLRVVPSTLVCVCVHTRGCGVCVHGDRVGDLCRPLLGFAEFCRFPHRAGPKPSLLWVRIPMSFGGGGVVGEGEEGRGGEGLAPPFFFSFVTLCHIGALRLAFWRGLSSPCPSWAPGQSSGVGMGW
jgi:hypothetical protein